MEKRRALVFATNNPHKLRELREIAGESYDILSLADIGCHDDIPETADTLEGNAAQKVAYVKQHYGYDCFADDTGLFVKALGGAPGVYTARYAGEGCTPADNVVKLLSEMAGCTDRRAYFRTVIAFIEGDKMSLHEGRIDGSIVTEPRGIDGFGYDPVFIPEGTSQTFAEMGPDEKNAISHRRRATDAFIKFLKR